MPTLLQYMTTQAKIYYTSLVRDNNQGFQFGLFFVLQNKSCLVKFRLLCEAKIPIAKFHFALFRQG
jgi:hypothetical protein